jgi:hypothetical protein
MLRASGREAVVLGPGVLYTTDAFRTLQKLNSDDPDRRAAALRAVQEKGRMSLSEALERAVTAAGGHYVRVMPAICPDGVCPVKSSDGDLFVFDTTHYTLGGARDVADAIGPVLPQ